MAYFWEEERKSPINLYLDWKGHETDWMFVYYDKETKENVTFNLKEFIIIKRGFVIKWFNEKCKFAHDNGTGIFSNEIEQLNKERFIVRYQDNGRTPITEWFYSEIKEKANSVDGYLQLAITAMELATGKLVKFYMKGKAMYNLWTLLDSGDRNTQKIKFTGFTDEENKKGKTTIKYRLPVFEWAGDIAEEERASCIEFAKAMRAYDSNLKANISDGDGGDDVPASSDPIPTDEPFKADWSIDASPSMAEIADELPF